MNGGHHFFSDAEGRRARAGRGRFERRSFAKATNLCAVSHYVGETTRRLISIPAARPIHVIPNPVDTDRFRPRDDIEEDPNLVLFAGTLCEKKGVRQLVQAWPKVHASFPDARLMLAGRDSTRDLGTSFAAHLRAVASNGGVDDSIEMLGAVPNDDLGELIARASVCVYPSHMEACPVAWLEAMASGRAVVASETGPGPELIEDGITGVLCDPCDPESIAESVCRALDDRPFRNRLGANARQRAVLRFSTRALLPANEDFFARCVER
jgi:glycosyltransferase involved in cell wall biosynthesis